MSLAAAFHAFEVVGDLRTCTSGHSLDTVCVAGER